MSILSLNNVSIAYGSLVAVEDVSFGVGEGDFFCIVGANGSGKSTLLRGVLGMLPLLRGSVDLAPGRDRVSWVPQGETGERDFPATVREVVLTGTQRRGLHFPFYSKADREAAEASMNLFGIDALAGRQIGRLSGGQRQRAMLARAMCRRPSLLFLDEPCAGLDAETKETFYETLCRLNRERGLTIVMVTHDLSDVENCATHVVALARKPVFVGDIEMWRDSRN